MSHTLRNQVERSRLFQLKSEKLHLIFNLKIVRPFKTSICG